MGSWFSSPKPESEVLSVSLGMVVIDEIRMPSRPPIVDVAGGSAIYATLGCRLFAGCARSSDVGCLVLAGKDFPVAIRNQLSGWKLSLVFNVYPDKLSTRGLLEYEDDTFGPKKFRYTTPPLKVSPAHLTNTLLLNSRAFHVLATPEEIQQHIPELIRLRARHGVKNRPYIVWEPFPAACTTINRRSFVEACRLVGVFSPNHLEMTALFEDRPPDGFQPENLERYALEFAQSVGADTADQGAVVIRAGKHGSLTTIGSTKTVWLPAFYQDKSPKVIDPTGAGNAFLGGFIAGWHLLQDAKEASVYGNVAASFALEQIGLPSFQNAGNREFWNGEQVMDRLKEYKARISNSGRL